MGTLNQKDVGDAVGFSEQHKDGRAEVGIRGCWKPGEIFSAHLGDGCQQRF